MGHVPLRRLNRAEYQKTLADLLRVPVDANDVVATEIYGPSGYAEGGPITPDDVDRMLGAVEVLVTRYATSQMSMDMPCQPKSDADRACAEAFVKAFGARAYRHPLSLPEATDLMAIYDQARRDRNLFDALALVVKAALLSPRFNYRRELGDEKPEEQDGVIVLGNYELASRLSYFLWQSMPDDELFKAAENGDLHDPRLVAAQVERMLEDTTRAAEGIQGFFSAWLPLHEIDASNLNDPERAVKASMLASLMAFVQDLVLGAGDARYETLLSANYTFADKNMATLLRLHAPAGESQQKVLLKDDARVGLFTHPAFLAATTDTPLTTVIRRGRFVFEKLGACQAVPPLEGSIPDPPPRREDASVREHLAEHAENGACRSCHQFMDPMGFAFDLFDNLGQLRDNDDYGKPIDTKGSMPLTEEITLTFVDAADLLRQLAKHELSQACFARQMLGYALRLPTDANNEASFDAVSEHFVKGGANIRSLLTAATQSHLFYYRKPSPGEAFQ